MDEGTGAQNDDRRETQSEATESREAQPEMPASEVERITEEAQEAATEQLEEVREVAADVEAKIEEVKAEAEAAGEEVREAAADLGESTQRAMAAAQAGVAHEARAVTTEAQETAEDVVRATQEHIAATEEMPMAPEYQKFSFGNGFRFGCGFAVAGCLVWLVASILLVAIPMVLSALNVIGLPGS